MLFVDEIPKWKHPPEVEKKTAISGSFYDEAYFQGKIKSNWSVPYTQENYGMFFKNVAQFLVEGFPLARTYLDVGCAKGYLVNGLHEIGRLNNFDIHAEGFDISKTAIANAHPDAMPFVQQASVDSYQFKHKFDMMICLDVLEHCTTKQIRNFLTRTRPYVNDSIFAQIPLPHAPNVYDEPSHVSIHPRKWWHEMFLECGWKHPEPAVQQQALAMTDIVPQAVRWDVFIYRSGNGEFE